MSCLLRNFIFFAILCILFSFEAARAYEFDLQCDSNGSVQGEILQNQEIRITISDQIKRGINSVSLMNDPPKSCPMGNVNPLKLNVGAGLVLTNEVNSRARVWSSRSQNPETIFDREKIQEIIAQALKSNVDPFRQKNKDRFLVI